MLYKCLKIVLCTLVSAKTVGLDVGKVEGEIEVLARIQNFFGATGETALEQRAIFARQFLCALALVGAHHLAQGHLALAQEIVVGQFTRFGVLLAGENTNTSYINVCSM